MRKIVPILINYFFRGLLFVVPFAATIYVIVLMFNLIDGLLGRLLGPYLPEYGIVPGLGILTLVLLVTLLGFFASSVVGRSLARRFATLLDRTPLVKTLYSAIKDLLSAFVGKEKRFNRPVLVSLGEGMDLERIGFVTSAGTGLPGLGDDRVAVYLPHAYAWSGNLVIVPRRNVTPLECDAVEAMKFAVSAGVSGDLGKSREERKKGVRLGGPPESAT